MRISHLPDCSMYQPEEITREAPVRIELMRLEGHCYLALVAALDAGKLDGAESWRCQCGRLVVPTTVRANGRDQVVWHESTVAVSGRSAVKVKTKGGRSRSANFQDTFKGRNLSKRAQMRARVSG